MALDITVSAKVGAAYINVNSNGCPQNYTNYITHLLAKLSLHLELLHQ